MQITLYRYVFPQVKRIGVLYSKYNKHRFRNAEAAAKEMDVALMGRSVSKKRDTLPALSELLKEIDALWLISDPVIMSDKETLKFLDKLPAKQFKQISKKIFSLMADPEPHDSKELKGSPYRGTNIGEYRIIYRLEDDVLKIAIVGKRNDPAVYKELTRG